MNCKPGDTAIICQSLEGNEGAIVAVLEFDSHCPCGRVRWACEALQTFRIFGKREPPGTVASICDRVLRPIRNRPGEDEMITLAGKPPQLEKT